MQASVMMPHIKAHTYCSDVRNNIAATPLIAIAIPESSIFVPVVTLPPLPAPCRWLGGYCSLWQEVRLALEPSVASHAIGRDNLRKVQARCFERNPTAPSP